MKRSNHVYSGVWVDHSSAYILNVQDNIWKMIKLRSHVPRLHRSTGGSRKSLPYVFDGGGNDHKLKNRIRNAEKSFYEKIEQNILPHSKVYIVGPSLAKKELTKYMQGRHRNQITMEACEKLTSKQFVAKVKKHFNLAGQLEDHL